MMWLMFAITLASSVYAVYCQHRYHVFKQGFILLAKIAYNPKNADDVKSIVEKIKDELIRLEETNR